MNESIRVRQIQSWEGAALRDIRLRAIADRPDAFAVSLAQTLAETDEGWTSWATRSALGDAHILYVAEDSGTWIGMVGGMPAMPNGEAGAELISLWVDPAYRGHGLGRHLVEQIISWGRDHRVRQLELWVTTHNTAAIELYRKSGFRDEGKSQPSPSDASLSELRMVHEL
jgi:ribosomal protein S18 acetylase RimI-like enzyme